MNQLSEKLKSVRESKKLNRSQMASLLGISSQLYGQYEDGKRVPKMPFFIKWKEKFGSDLVETNVSHETGNKVEGPDYSQPIMQVVLNLSYIGRTDSETMKKMAATNQKNTEIIAALVAEMLPNSKLAAQLSSSLVDLHKDGDLPAEAFLPEGADLSKKVKLKESEKNR